MKSIIKVILLLMTPYVFSQSTGSITGQVKLDGHPVLGAEVTVIGKASLGAVTNEKGNFILDNVPLGEQIVQFNYVSAIPERKKILVKVADNKQQFVNLQLDNQLNEVVVSGTLKPISRMESPVLVEVYS